MYHLIFFFIFFFRFFHSSLPHRVVIYPLHFFLFLYYLLQACFYLSRFRVYFFFFLLYSLVLFSQFMYFCNLYFITSLSVKEFLTLYALHRYYFLALRCVFVSALIFLFSSIISIFCNFSPQTFHYILLSSPLIFFPLTSFTHLFLFIFLRNKSKYPDR